MTKIRHRIVVFTDLDGTLLDHQTYSFDHARPALEFLAGEGIPLVLCSSKTRAEIELLRQELLLPYPFISENGGALFVPHGYFPFDLPDAQPIAGYDVLRFGVPYFQLVELLHVAASETGVPVVGFSDMSVEEVARDCNLTPLGARLAKLREHDEPFRILVEDEAIKSRLFGALHGAGLRCVPGGRYHHVTGVSEKGLSARMLTWFYERAWGDVFTVGLGDSLNDASLLQSVHAPIVVRNPASETTTALLRKVPNARLTQATGPSGWCEAVFNVVGRRLQTSCGVVG